jgi:hypothetical protein
MHDGFLLLVRGFLILQPTTTHMHESVGVGAVRWVGASALGAYIHCGGLKQTVPCNPKVCLSSVCYLIITHDYCGMHLKCLLKVMSEAASNTSFSASRRAKVLLHGGVGGYPPGFASAGAAPSLRQLTDDDANLGYVVAILRCMMLLY